MRTQVKALMGFAVLLAAALAVQASAVAADAVGVTVDFGQPAGAMKPLHGVNNSPTSRVVRLTIKGAPNTMLEIARLDDTHDSEKAEPFDPAAPLELGPHQVVLIATASEEKEVERGGVRKVFAGQAAAEKK